MLRAKTLISSSGLLLCLGVAGARAQEPPAELPRRVPAQIMSFRGADWLERPQRTAEELPDELLATMGLEDGDVVADIGAGSGFYTRRMARLVAPDGAVFAVDLQPEMLEILEDKVSEENLIGVVPVLGEVDDPRLPDDTIDWILLVDVYHEFSNPTAMLAKMRQALKPAGRVALVEYRVEDGTGDHIRAGHRMSVRQVLNEWLPAGFDLVELHEFLPSQHLFVFQPVPTPDVSGAGPRTGIAHYDVLEAIREGLVEVSAAGLGADSVSLTIRRTRPEPLIVSLSVGTYFEASGEAGDMVGRRDGAIMLLDDDPRAWTVMARRASQEGAVARAGDRLEIHSADERTAIRNLMWMFQRIDVNPAIAPMVEQLALWITSENAGYDRLAEHASAASMPPKNVVALAAAYTNAAGVDITQKRIWAERESYVPGLTDQALARFFEALERN